MYCMLKTKIWRKFSVSFSIIYSKKETPNQNELNFVLPAIWINLQYPESINLSRHPITHYKRLWVKQFVCGVCYATHWNFHFVACYIVIRNYEVCVKNCFWGITRGPQFDTMFGTSNPGKCGILPLPSRNECKNIWKLSVRNFDTLILSCVTCGISKFYYVTCHITRQNYEVDVFHIFAWLNK